MKYALDVSIAGDYADPRLLASLAADAEASGWDGFFLWDAIFAESSTVPMGDPWISLAAIATSTKRIRIGALVTPLARRRPWQIARETVALDHLSGGRVTFGVGLGYQDLDFDAFGEDPDPRTQAQKLDEALEVLEELWSGRRVSFSGRYYRVNGVKFLPKPLQKPRIPFG
jgi:alkanesulfonate monooxygenase SsuD/methylene tetrahydromethanopterin reductase-like flavin-dependent oxidoreductase (luciferase family)